MAAIQQPQPSLLSRSNSLQDLNDTRVSSPLGRKIRSRKDLAHQKRIVIKAGTTVVTNENNGRFSLTRVGSLVEQIAELMLCTKGFEVILVSSGATGCGRQKLKTQEALRESVGSRAGLRLTEHGGTVNNSGYNSACAAAGQLGLMSLYETLFSQVRAA